MSNANVAVHVGAANLRAYQARRNNGHTQQPHQPANANSRVTFAATPREITSSTALVPYFGKRASPSRSRPAVRTTGINNSTQGGLAASVASTRRSS